MPDLAADLARLGRALPPTERVRLLDLLLESLHESPAGQVEVAWDKEIERRVAAHERGEGRLYERDEVMAEAARVAPWHMAVPSIDRPFSAPAQTNFCLDLGLSRGRVAAQGLAQASASIRSARGT